MNNQHPEANNLQLWKSCANSVARLRHVACLLQTGPQGTLCVPVDTVSACVDAALNAQIRCAESTIGCSELRWAAKPLQLPAIKV